MKYEISIRQLEEFSPEEQKIENVRMRNFDVSSRYSDKNFHERRVLFAELSEKEFEAVKKAVLSVV